MLRVTGPTPLIVRRASSRTLNSGNVSQVLSMPPSSDSICLFRNATVRSML